MIFSGNLTGAVSVRRANWQEELFCARALSIKIERLFFALSPAKFRRGSLVSYMDSDQLEEEMPSDIPTAMPFLAAPLPRAAVLARGCGKAHLRISDDCLAIKCQRAGAD
ncbi:hypothetical protein [Pseudotabrizicola sp. L79]|uniref:hypothetical protein n=1 Tax=Pseudotabrizicola sp. L79 TaxID=3118402 RepID=UPI002F94B983